MAGPIVVPSISAIRARRGYPEPGERLLAPKRTTPRPWLGLRCSTVHRGQLKRYATNGQKSGMDGKATGQNVVDVGPRAAGSRQRCDGNERATWAAAGSVRMAAARGRASAA